jgi:hypothetical protein
VEARHVIQRFQERADIGVSAFVTASRLWAGDAPYGMDTPVLPNVGIGVLAGIPRGSKRMLRLDLAMPLRRGVDRSGFEVRFSLFDRTNIIREESGDIERARDVVVAPSILRP